MSEVVQEVGERVKVLASFAERKIVIHYFTWRDRKYVVNSMNLFHIERDGNKHIYNFAVSANSNTYQLTFDPVTLEWRLKDVLTI